MPDTPNPTEQLWETELRDATNAIPDTEATPTDVDGMEAIRRALIDHTISLYQALGWPADLDPDDALTRAAELRADLDQARAYAKQVVEEATAVNHRLHAQKAMARAEVDELRARIAEAHKIADRLENGYLLPLSAEALRDALDGPKPDPAREVALDEMAYESARETTDVADHQFVNTRDKDSVRYVQCAYDSFPGLEGGRCISNATDGPYCKPHADAIAEYDATNRKEK